MQPISYEQIIYASTEKSALNGQAGFGVRTYSKGLTAEEVRDISNTASINYQIPLDQMVGKEDLDQDPSVVLKYAPTFTFKEVSISSGQTFWVLARTVYIGIDYGYFNDDPYFQRSGSNYLTHMLVFRQQPPLAVLRTAVSGDVFLPQNRVCSKDNPEWHSLLLGEPTLLDTGTIDPERLPRPTADDNFAKLTIALMQAFKNKHTGNDINRILVKAPDAVQPKLLAMISYVTDRLAGGMGMQTNFMQSYGVPEGMGLAFVGERNNEDISYDSHITVDLNQGTQLNIEQNELYDRLTENLSTGRSDVVAKLLNLWTSISHTPETDYGFAYKMMLLAQTDEAIAIDELTDEFLSKLHSHGGTDAETVWRKVNRTINDAFQSPADDDTYGEHAASAFYAICRLNAIAPERLDLEQESCDTLTEAFFTYHRLGSIINDDLEFLPTAIKMLQRSKHKVSSTQSVLEELNSTDKTEIWRKVIRLYIPNNELQPKAVEIIPAIIRAEELPDKLQLLTELYPAEWLLAQDIHDDEYYELLSPLASGQQRRKVDSLFHLAKAPEQRQIDEIRNSRFRLSGDVEATLNDLEALANKSKLAKADAKLFATARRWWRRPGEEQKYVTQVFAQWLDTTPKPDELVALIKQERIDPKETARLLTMIWRNYSPVVTKSSAWDGKSAVNREDFVLAVIDNTGDAQLIADYADASDLRDFILKQKGLLKQVMRKVLGFIKK